MTERNQNYINTVKMEEIPWHRIPTTYGRATLFPRYFEVLEQMKNIEEVEAALYEVSINIEHQSTLWYAAPFTLIFLGRLFKKALAKSSTNKSARYIVEDLLEGFDIIAESFRDGDELEHADPLPFFEDMLKEEYLWSEVYDEEEDELRYEEENVFPDDLFYSFYYYSFEVLKIYRKEFEILQGTGFDERARSLCSRFEEKNGK